MFTFLEALPTGYVTINGLDKVTRLVQQLMDWGISAGKQLIAAILVFIIGRFIVSIINKLVYKLLDRQKVDAGIQSFVRSFVNIVLTILLIVAVVSKLGVDTTAFAALLASAGVAVGMALSGNLQNFAGGLIILLLRPIKVGDFIQAQGVSGTVTEIQIFHTILRTPDNKLIFVPNGSLSSSTLTNFSREPQRRVDWSFGVSYGEDFEKVEQALRNILAADKRILTDPAPFIALEKLADSSVNIVVRVWVKQEDYWGVYFDINKTVYAEFNKAGIDFPFPQLTIHQDN